MSGKDELTKEQLKQAVCEAIDRHGNEIIELGEKILRHPETGFNEGQPAALVAGRMGALGLAPETGLALTGVRGRRRGRAPGPRLAVIGELDSLRTSEHPLADPQTGAAHSCGHNAQIANTQDQVIIRHPVRQPPPDPPEPRAWLGGAAPPLSFLFFSPFLPPPLFIPWSAMESVTEKRYIVSTYTAIRVRGEWPAIALRGRAGHYVREAYAHASAPGVERRD